MALRLITCRPGVLSLGNGGGGAKPSAATHYHHNLIIYYQENEDKLMAQKRQLGKRLTKAPHGAPKGNQNAKGCKGGPGIPHGVKLALKHGLYGVGYTEEEKELYPHMQMGNLKDEADNARFMLRRACKAQLMWERQKGIFNEHIRQGVKAALGSTTAAELFHVESIEIKEGILTADVLAEGETVPIQISTPASETKIIRRKTDFSAEILKYTNMVLRLEETQLKLMGEGSGEDYARKLAQDIREFGDAAMALMPGNNYQRENV